LQTAPTDIELWNAFKTGDRKAFTDLFKRFYSMLIQYGAKLCSNPHQLEDCVQELFIELWQSPSATPVLSVRAYLLKALKYKIFKLNHRQTPFSAVTDDMIFEISHENFLIHSMEDQQKTFRIIDAIRQLPARQKEIVYLKLFKQLSYQEVSEVMQINYQAARNLFYNAIKSLREMQSS
jgi:RNA polymerase sigma-70 factor (ECF subfamily)